MKISKKTSSHHKDLIKEYATEPREISEESYQYYLEVLPPLEYIKDNRGESFKIDEIIIDNIVNICCCIERRCFVFKDSVSLTHDEIINKVKNSFAYQNFSPKTILLTLDKDEIELIFKGEKKIVFKSPFYYGCINEDTLAYIYQKDVSAIVGSLRISQILFDSPKNLRQMFASNIKEKDAKDLEFYEEIYLKIYALSIFNVQKLNLIEIKHLKIDPPHSCIILQENEIESIQLLLQ